MSLIVTGSIGIDTVETPTGTAERVLGGSAIYFAAAASFFVPVRLVGAVGEDFPDSLRRPFEHFKVDMEGFEVRKGSKTFAWRGRYHENMNQRDTVEVHLNVLAEALPPVPPSYRDSRYIFLANTHPGGQLALLDSFPEHQLAIADTMDLWIETERDLLVQLLKRIDGLVLNDGEAIQLTGQTNLIKAGQAIREMGPRFVVIKKGEHGSLLVHEEGCVALPAFPTDNVVDPTGAGDSFAGGMMGYLASREQWSLGTLRTAMAYGTVVASYNIESFSLERMMQINRETIDDRLTTFGQMLRI